MKSKLEHVSICSGDHDARKKPTRTEVKTAISLARELDVLIRHIENHFRRDCFAECHYSILLELDGAAEQLLSMIVEALGPLQKLDEVRKLPSPLQRFAVSGILYTLDRTVEDGEDNPDALCMDGYSELLDLPGYVDTVLADLSLHTADDLLAWLEAHTPEGFWSEEY